MRERMILHVAGPAGSGKTSFIERLLEAEVALTLSVRGVHEPKLKNVHESSPQKHPELQRYQRAGAYETALYRFPIVETDAFFLSRIMDNYSQAVFIEGDCPIDSQDLTAFVAPPPAEGQVLLHRVVRNNAARHQASIAQFEQMLATPEGAARLIAAELGDTLAKLLLQEPRMRADLQRTMEAKLAEMRRQPPLAPTEHWYLAPEYAGLEPAQLVIVNVRSENERCAAAALIADVARLRQDDAVFREVIGSRGYRLPITAVAADLSNPQDPGVKKAVARVKRAIKQRVGPGRY